MPTAVPPANDVNGTTARSESESEATRPAWILRVFLQNLARHQRGLYFNHREMFREALVVRV